MLSTSRRGRKDDQMFDSQTLEAEINETSSAQCEHADRRSRSRSPEPKNTSLTKSRDTAENNNNIFFFAWDVQRTLSRTSVQELRAKLIH